MVDAKPHYAPGSEDILDKPATPAEINQGKFTPVTRLSWDEVDPSRLQR